MTPTGYVNWRECDQIYHAGYKEPIRLVLLESS